MKTSACMDGTLKNQPNTIGKTQQYYHTIHISWAILQRKKSEDRQFTCFSDFACLVLRDAIQQSYQFCCSWKNSWYSFYRPLGILMQTFEHLLPSPLLQLSVQIVLYMLHTHLCIHLWLTYFGAIPIHIELLTVKLSSYFLCIHNMWKRNGDTKRGKNADSSHSEVDIWGEGPTSNMHEPSLKASFYPSRWV